MSKWKQSVGLLFLFSGLCLSACGKDEAETGVVTELITIEEATEIEEAETAEAANCAAESDIHDEEYYMDAIEDIAGDSTMANEMLYQLQNPYSFLLHVTEPTGGLAYEDYRFRNIVEASFRQGSL